MPRCPDSIASRLCARVALLALLTAGLADADNHIEVPEGCGSELEWHAELERLTGASAASTVEVQVQITRLGPSEHELRLSVGDERRVLRDPVCRVLWRSALVIAAAASRPESERPPPVSPAAPAPSPGASPPDAVAPSPAPPSPVPPSPAPAANPLPPPRPATPASAARAAPRTAPQRRASTPRRPRESASAPRSLAPQPAARESEPDAAASHVLRLGGSLALGVSSGVVPGWGPALEATVQLEKRPWAVALALRHWPERGQTIDGRSVLVSATGGRATALFRVAPALELLGGIELNRLIGEGSANVRGPASDVAWQLAPVLGASFITMDVGYLRLELGALARLSLIRPRFEVTGFGTLYRAPALGADAIIRGVLLFW